MTLIILAQVACDAAECQASRWADSASAVWAQARSQGWGRDGEQHYCPKHRLIDPRVDRIRELAGMGLSDARIGTRLGMSRGGVQSIRYAHNIPGRRPGRPNSTREVVPS